MSSTKNLGLVGCKITLLTLTRVLNSTKAEFESHNIGFPVKYPRLETWIAGLEVSANRLPANDVLINSKRQRLV